jgi:hypothetical protein
VELGSFVVAVVDSKKEQERAVDSKKGQEPAQKFEGLETNRLQERVVAVVAAVDNASYGVLVAAAVDVDVVVVVDVDEVRCRRCQRKGRLVNIHY